jgi:outer membrane protein assembly factor BamE
MNQVLVYWSAWIFLFTAAGCSSRFFDPNDLPLVYKIDVQQGNVVDQEMLAQLEPGMDKNKVKLIMGTPLVTDAFHQDRWDYIYTFQEGGGERVERHIVLQFKDGLLEKIGGDVRPARGGIKREPRKEVIVEVPNERKARWFERWMGGIGLGGDDKGSSKGKREEPTFDPANPDDSGGL